MSSVLAKMHAISPEMNVFEKTMDAQHARHRAAEVHVKRHLVERLRDHALVDARVQQLAVAQGVEVGQAVVVEVVFRDVLV